MLQKGFHRTSAIVGLLNASPRGNTKAGSKETASLSDGIRAIGKWLFLEMDASSQAIKLIQSEEGSWGVKESAS